MMMSWQIVVSERGHGLKLLLGIAPPDQSQGAVAYDILEGHEMVRERPE